MGYDSTFDGIFTVEPPLNEAEMDYLRRFAGTRHADSVLGPYAVGDLKAGYLGDGNRRENAPSLWCRWTPEASDRIGWDGWPKFHVPDEWIGYLIEHFLRPGAEAATSGDPQFRSFTFDHVVNGRVLVQGQDPRDRWAVVVTNNEVSIEPDDSCFTFFAELIAESFEAVPHAEHLHLHLQGEHDD